MSQASRRWTGWDEDEDGSRKWSFGKAHRSTTSTSLAIIRNHPPVGETDDDRGTRRGVEDERTGSERPRSKTVDLQDGR